LQIASILTEVNVSTQAFHGLNGNQKRCGFWDNFNKQPNPLTSMLEGNLQLLEAIGCLVVTEPKTNMTWDFTDLRTDGRWQFLQDIGHVLRSNDTSTGTCIKYGKICCASHLMNRLAGKTFGFTGGHQRLSMELHRTPEGLLWHPLG